jgi:hypothetical protein
MARSHNSANSSKPASSSQLRNGATRASARQRCGEPTPHFPRRWAVVPRRRFYHSGRATAVRNMVFG